MVGGETGRYTLPARAEMERQRTEMYEESRAGYVASTRHTIQIDCGEYAYGLRLELKRGVKRAEQARRKLPIAPRAAAPLDTRALRQAQGSHSG